jgi:protoporphyrinogen oxidase
MKIVIVGAGLSGLTLAERLSKKHDITLIEKEKFFGGLSRSVQYKNSIFDIGPHFFVSKDEKVLKYLYSFFDDSDSLIEDLKKTRFYIRGKYINWPPTMLQLLTLDFLTMLDTGFRVINSMFSKKKSPTLEDYFINNYGNSLYKLIFKPLFSTFTKHDGSKIDAAFATRTLNIAAEQENTNLINIALNVITKRKIEFLYPRYGLEDLIQNIRKKVTESDRVDIKTGVSIVSIDMNKIVIDGKEEIKFDKIIWTAPLTTLCDILSINSLRLRFLNLVLYNIELKKCKQDYHYAYIVQEGRPFHRISLLHNVSSSLSKNKLATFEKTTLNDSESNFISSKERNEIEKELILLDVISSPSDIIAIYKKFVPYAYPLFYKGFKKDLETVKRKIMEKNKNIILIGRSGNYSYINMDDVFKESIEFNIKK